MRALGLNLLAATCVVSLTVVTPSPTKSEASSVSLGFGQTNVSLIGESVTGIGGIATLVRIGVIVTHTVHRTIAPTDASALSLVATSASGLVPTNAMAMIATGDAVAGLIKLVG